MSAGSHFKVLTEFIAETGGVPIESVLMHPLFANALRAELPSLIECLVSPLSICLLTKWLFDESMIDRPDFVPISRICIQLLTSPSQELLIPFATSEILSQMMFDFLKSESSANPLLCGFLSRILIVHVRFGQLGFFEQHPDACDLLLSRIQSTGIQDLIVFVGATQPAAFQDLALILSLTEIAITNPALSDATLSVVLEIWDNIDENDELFTTFCDEKVLHNLIQFSLNSKSYRLAADLMELVSRVIDADSTWISVLQDFEQELTPRPGNLHLSVFLLGHMDLDPADLFALYFEPDACPHFHDHCASVMSEMSSDQLAEVARLPGFLPRIIDLYGKEGWCPHMLTVILAFVFLLTETGFYDEKWEAFIGVVNPLVDVLTSPYGGLPPGWQEGEVEDPLAGDDAEDEEEEAGEGGAAAGLVC
jgi:hypothetical protein